MKTQRKYANFQLKIEEKTNVHGEGKFQRIQKNYFIILKWSHHAGTI